jgi:hypothetical protein
LPGASGGRKGEGVDRFDPGGVTVPKLGGFGGTDEQAERRKRSRSVNRLIYQFLPLPGRWV